MDGEGNVLDVHQNLVYGSVMLTAYFYLLHYCVYQHLIHFLCLYVKLIFLVVEFVQDAFQICN